MGERVCCIILAAGSSKRMGEEKALVKLDQESYKIECKKLELSKRWQHYLTTFKNLPKNTKKKQPLTGQSVTV